MGMNETEFMEFLEEHTKYDPWHIVYFNGFEVLTSPM